jgi:hypothetical protein
MKFLPFLILLVVLLACANHASQSGTTGTSVDTRRQERVAIVNQLNGVGGFVTSIDGPNYDVLVITHKMLADPRARWKAFEKRDHSQLKAAGFRQVILQTGVDAKAQRWNYDL